MNLNDNLDDLDDLDYEDLCNQTTTAIIQAGVDFTDEKNDTVESIMEICNEIYDESELKDVKDSIFAKIFNIQITLFMMGALRIFNAIEQYNMTATILFENIDIATISLESDVEQEEIIATSYSLTDVIMDRVVNKTAYESEESTFEEKLSTIISVYLDSSYISGLTAAKSLNYVKNKGKMSEVELNRIFEAISPRIYQLPEN
jgi:hypothetical protein